jgi:hypothetical protein
VKKWLGKLKERLGRLKPWLKQHWKAVLIVGISAAVFLYIVLKKPSLAQAAVNPPADAGASSGGDPGVPTPDNRTSGTGASGGLVGAVGHGTSGGSLFDPVTGSPTKLPTTGGALSLSPYQAGGAFGPGTSAFAEAHGPITGPTTEPASLFKPGTSALSPTLANGAPNPFYLGFNTPSGISQMWSAAKSLAAKAKPAPGVKNGVIQGGPLAGVRQQGPATRKVSPAPKPAPPAHKVSSAKKVAVTPLAGPNAVAVQAAATNKKLQRLG